MKRTTSLLALTVAAGVTALAFVNFNKSIPPTTLPVHSGIVKKNLPEGKTLIVATNDQTISQTSTQKQQPLVSKKPVADCNCATQQKPKLQVAFVLDVTGSMSGLLHTAKEKIWSIALSLSQTQPAPEIEIGLVAYRDRGDAFVTKVTDLDKDIDLVYSELMNLSADGGGDEPESVNQGLNDAVNKLNWDNDPCTYRSIFLVGDCPPHMDYGDDVKYYMTCDLARKKDIFVNAIQMGEAAGTEPIWTEIASLGHGEYMRVGMDAGGLTYSTPYDEDIARKSAELEGTKLYYGSASFKAEQKSRTAESISLNYAATPSAAAERATFNISSAGATNMWGSNELLKDVADGKVEAEDLSREELPAEFKSLSDDELENTIEQKLEDRTEIQSDLNALILKREEYVQEKISGDKAATSINSKIFDTVKKQASSKSIELKGKAKQ